MPINPEAVGVKGTPSKRKWTSKDALLYAVGVGAGTDELSFTTENTKDTPQRVLPTFAVIIGGGGTPFDKIGSFNPALMVHGEQGIELFDEIPAEGEIESTGECTAIWDKGNAAVVEFESTSINTATGKPLLKTRSMLFCRGEGGFNLGAQRRLIGLDREQPVGALIQDRAGDTGIGGDGIDGHQRVLQPALGAEPVEQRRDGGKLAGLVGHRLGGQNQPGG